MASNDACPECSNNGWNHDASQYALIKTNGGVLKLDLQAGTEAMVVKATTCVHCGFVKLFT